MPAATVRRVSLAAALTATVATAAVVAGLAVTNPGRPEFEQFAADQLVDELESHICRGDVLPALVRLALHNCPRLVQDQRRAIGAFVGRHTARLNLGVMSVYRSRFGGDTLLGWPLPRFESTVLAAAGQFLLVQAEVRDPEPQLQQPRAPER